MVLKQSYTKAVDWWALGKFKSVSSMYDKLLLILHLVGILIYEMLVGHSPFYNANQFTTYENIVSGKVSFPNDFDPTAKDLIQRLLVPEMNNRLGTGKVRKMISIRLGLS